MTVSLGTAHFMRNAKLIILLFIIVGAIAAFSWFWLFKIPDSFVQEGRDVKFLLDLTDDFSEVWKEGEDSKLFGENTKSCKLKNVGDSRCNLDFLNCVLKEGLLKKTNFVDVKILKFQKINKLKFGERSPREGAKLVLSKNKSRMTYIFNSHCRKIYLPQRIYGFGADKNPEEKNRFDNFDRDIFIDKEMNDGTGLTINEMKIFCKDRGMQLLPSHILDAASFHPVDIKNNRPLNFLRPPLPWTRRFKSEFISKAQNDENFKFEPKYCDYLFSKECIDTENKSLPSWMGLKNPLGDKIEVVKNISKKLETLIPSSSYFSIHSQWHILGKRSSWNGISFNKNDFPLKIEAVNNYKDLKLGFRCMQEEWIR